MVDLYEKKGSADSRAARERRTKRGPKPKKKTQKERRGGGDNTDYINGGRRRAWKGLPHSISRGDADGT